MRSARGRTRTGACAVDRRRLFVGAMAATIVTVAGCTRDRGGRSGVADVPPDRADTEQFRPLAVGDAVPAYVVSTVAGDTIRIGPGQPVTLVNVWATWCASCLEEMADLEALRREFGPTGVRIVAVSVDGGDGTRVRRFARAHHLAFIVAHDAGARIKDLYQTVGVPETYLVSRDGRLLWHHVGNLHAALDELRTAIGHASRSAELDTLVSPARLGVDAVLAAPALPRDGERIGAAVWSPCVSISHGQHRGFRRFLHGRQARHHPGIAHVKCESESEREDQP